jgi:hypothetical protein
MKPLSWLLAVLFLEALVYVLIYRTWGLSGIFFLGALDFAILALFQHLRFTAPSAS